MAITYRDAGVDIDAGNRFVDRIKSLVTQTHSPEVLTGLGGFAGLYDLGFLSSYQKPALVATTDGVGTKLKLAIELKSYNSVGIDLVAMCANDLICCGAKPLFFLDYYATGQLNVDEATQVIQGIVEGCKQATMALIGGETAEMPGMYQKKDYDLAGFAVGIVDQVNAIDGKKVTGGDQLIALGSSGPHSNGYSLIRKILSSFPHWQTLQIKQQLLADLLLAPTKIYVKTILALMSQVSIHALAHITGGGILDNLPRVLPDDCQAQIDCRSWKLPPVFEWLKTQSKLEEALYRTFNCGVGMIMVVAKEDVDTTLNLCQQLGETAWHLGEIITHPKGCQENPVKLIHLNHH